MISISSQDVQHYTRMALQYVAAYFIAHGTIPADASWVDAAIGFGVAAATLAWSIWGNRVSAKLASVEAIPGTKVVIDPTKAPAAAVVAANDDNRPKVVLAPAA